MKHKVDKPTIIILFLVFLWIAFWNIIVQAFHHSLEALPFSSWAFFISVTFFFLLEGHDMKKKFLQTLVGGGVGIALAALMILCYAWLMGMGLPHTAAICIPLVIIVGVLILAGPYCPIAFNNVGFGYFIIALISSETAVSNAPAYLLSLVIGCIILIGGSIFIITNMTKHFVKKATEAAKAAESGK